MPVPDLSASYTLSHVVLTTKPHHDMGSTVIPTLQSKEWRPGDITQPKGDGAVPPSPGFPGPEDNASQFWATVTSPGALMKAQILGLHPKRSCPSIHLSGLQRLAFLAGSLVMLLLLIWEPHVEFLPGPHS